MGKHTKFEENNKNKILAFRVLGLWLIRHNGKKYEVEHGSFIFSRTIWILWHIIGTALGIFVKESVKPTNHNHGTGSGFGDIFLDMALLIVIFLIVGPIQLKILMRNQEWLPKILQDIKTLENMDLGTKAKAIHRNPTVNFYQRNTYNRPTFEIEEGETGSTSSSTESLNEEEPDCCTRFNRLSTKIAFIVLGIVFFGAFSFAAYTQSSWDDTRDEYKLVMSAFYLVFPTLTTWLCILLIHHHANMYTVVLKMSGSSFKDPDTIRKISDYMTQMYRIFEKMSDHIFELTLGINFAIFVSVGTISMFEILQGLLGRKGQVPAATSRTFGIGSTAAAASGALAVDQSFSDILYVIPLAWCIGHIYQVCKASDHLYHHSHHELFLKMKKLLPDLIMPVPYPQAPQKLDDLPFKKVECVYKTIKDWPPKVCVYGGFQVNYKILTGIMFFIFAYARVFIRIAGNPPKPGAGELMASTPAPQG